MEKTMYFSEKAILDIAPNRFETMKVSVENYWKEKGHPLPDFLVDLKRPHAFLARHVATASFEALNFLELAQTMKLIPFWSEYLGDYYVTASARKTQLLIPRNRSGSRMRIIKNIDVFNKKILKDIYLENGRNLVELHHDIWEEKIASQVQESKREDFTQWLKSFGSAKDYYFAEMTLYLGHGVLFKDFHSGTNSQSFKSGFTDNIVMPAIKKVEKEFGMQAMVYRFKQEKHFPRLVIDDIKKYL